MTNDENYMRRCLQLAKLAAGCVAPNPMVGAVLAHGSKIIGEGYHEKYGEAHAEVNCVNSVIEQHKNLIKESTLYVSLEPCVHYGKTPPCTDMIIKNKIPKVVIGCMDIFDKVNGKGIRKLQNAGIDVLTGILEKECLELNKRFYTFHEKKRPYVILKWAQTFDCKIGILSGPSSEERLLVSNEYTNRLVHKWRSQEAAILVGTNTALYDNPSLTTRLWQGKTPLRLVVDLNLRLPSSLKVFNRKVKTIIFNKIKNEEHENLIYHKIKADNLLQEIMKVLYERGIQSILVEGGAKLLQSFIDAALWDEARIICNELMVIGDGVTSPELKQGTFQKKERYSNDTVSYFKNLFNH